MITFASRNLFSKFHFFLFFLSYIIFAIGDDPDRIKLSCSIFVITKISIILFQAINNYRSLQKLELFYDILMIGAVSLSGYYNTFIYMALGYVIYYGAVSILVFALRLRDINFINLYVPAMEDAITSLARVTGGKAAIKPALRVANNIYLRNNLILFLINIIILPLTKYYSYAGYYVLIICIIIPIINWYLILHITKTIVKLFSFGDKKVEESFSDITDLSYDFQKDYKIEVRELFFNAFKLGTYPPEDKTIVFKNLESLKKYYTKKIIRLQVVCKNYQEDLAKAQQSNDQIGIKNTEKLLAFAQNKIEKSQLEYEKCKFLEKAFKIYYADKSREALHKLINSFLKEFNQVYTHRLFEDIEFPDTENLENVEEGFGVFLSATNDKDDDKNSVDEAEKLKNDLDSLLTDTDSEDKDSQDKDSENKTSEDKASKEKTSEDKASKDEKK